MLSFDPNTRLAKVVCRANALLALPYLASALYLLMRSFIDPPFREYRGRPSLFIFVFIAFYLLLVYGQIRLRPWSRWLILIDALAGYALIYTFGFIGAYALTAHPGQLVYTVLGNIGRTVQSENLLWFAFAGKSLINTFTILYFFGGPVFRLAEKRRWAHLLWILPSLILVGLPVYVAAEMAKYTKQFHSAAAERIADEEFKKITCDQVRENYGKETTYVVEGHSVTVTFHYDFTGVWVKASDGKTGSSGGPKYFCRPDYRGPMEKTD